jgi:hypothetical protein
MAEYAPASLYKLFQEIQKAAPASWKVQLSGIIGDRSHTYGYHRGRNYVSKSDYSAVLSYDKGGDGNAACALDISLSAAGMRIVTQRLINAAESPTDGRPGALREFYGTVNGTTVVGRIHDGPDAKWRFSSSDDSHLWHVHLSFFRSMVNDADKLAMVRDIILGIEGADDVSAQDFWGYDPNKDKASGIRNEPSRADAKTNTTVQPSFALEQAWWGTMAIQRELAAAKLRDEAVLAAVKGLDTKAVLAAVDKAAKADQARTAEVLAALQSLASGGATAQAIVDELARRLAAGE